MSSRLFKGVFAWAVLSTLLLIYLIFNPPHDDGTHSRHIGHPLHPDHLRRNDIQPPADRPLPPKTIPQRAAQPLPANQGADAGEARNSDHDKAQAGQGNVGGDNVNSIKDVAAPNQHRPAQGTCKPMQKIIYIKTHKTGSSTLTNLFHRYGENHGLGIALPRDNIYYAWPQTTERAIVESVEAIDTHPSALPSQEGSLTYDIFASGHVRYLPSALEKLVPDGTYITILRDPASHFVSSFYHWHVHDHIRANGGPQLTYQQYLRGRDEYRKYLHDSDKVLTENSFIFDMNKETAETKEEVQELIAEMERKFAVVLITEYFDESLLLMKRQLCWTLDDIVYLRLKVSPPSKRDPQEWEDMKRIIYSFNWKDKMLYDHFNASLWKQIKQEPGFFEELAEYRSKLDEWPDKCGQWQYEDEDAHRVRLEESPDAPDWEKRCHKMLLDSKGYVKHLKKRAGYPIEDLECWPAAPARHVYNMFMESPASHALTSALYQFALQKGIVAALPENMETLKPQVLPPPEVKSVRFAVLDQRRSKPTYFSLPGMIYDRELINLLAPHPTYIAVVRKPVQEFLWAWKAMDVQTKLATATGNPSFGLADFLTNPNEFLPKLDPSTSKNLINRLATRLGLSQTSSRDEVKEIRKQLMWFGTILLAHRPLESVTLLRRILCWKIADVAHINQTMFRQDTDFALTDYATDGMDADSLRKAIENLNALDMELYGQIEWAFNARIERQVSFKEEMKIVDDQFREASQKCRSLGNTGSLEWSRCQFLMARSAFEAAQLYESKLDPQRIQSKTLEELKP